MTNRDNIARLKALIEALDISINQVAKLIGKSRPYVSRVLSGDIDAGSTFIVLESKLPELIALRKSSFFSLEGIQEEDLAGFLHLQPKNN